MPPPMTKVLTSSAMFMLGEVLNLRPDMGGGRWVVIKLLPRTERGFERALVREVADGLYAQSAARLRRTVWARKIQ
jgi:hypothetical protein